MKVMFEQEIFYHWSETLFSSHFIEEVDQAVRQQDYMFPSFIYSQTFYITRALLLIFTSETEMRQSRQLMIICFKLTNTLMTRLTSDVITRSLIII